VCFTLQKQRDREASLSETPDRSIIVVTIRGHENMTNEERAARIAQYIEQDPKRS